MAQVAHAAVEFALQYPEQARSTPIGVVLQVTEEEALIEWRSRFDYAHKGTVPYVLFFDPDVGDGEYTALATVTTGEEFADLPLAGRSMAGV
jgi:hypothetical protein